LGEPFRYRRGECAPYLSKVRCNVGAGPNDGADGFSAFKAVRVVTVNTVENAKVAATSRPNHRLSRNDDRREHVATAERPPVAGDFVPVRVVIWRMAGNAS
jgi:hypothetical protein